MTHKISQTFLKLFLVGAMLFLQSSFVVWAAEVGDSCFDDSSCTGYICIAENEEDELGACTKCNDNEDGFECFDGQVCSSAGKCVNKLGNLGGDDTLNQQSTGGDKNNGEQCSFDDQCKSGYCAPITGSSLPVCADRPSDSSSSGEGEPLGALCDDKKKCKTGLKCSDPKSGTCILDSSSSSSSTSMTSDGKIPGATSYNGTEINILGLVKGNNLGEVIVSIYKDLAVPLLGIIIFIHIIYGLLSEGILWSGSADKAGKFLFEEFKNGALAYIILLSAYIILNTINPDLVKNEFDVNAIAGQAPSALGGGGSGNTSGGGGTKGGGGPVGTPGKKCGPPIGGPCSIESLKSSCFGRFDERTLNEASAICFAESNGNVTAGKTDVCKDGNVFSWGLYQINLTVHQNTNSALPFYQCPSAFTARNFACTVKDRPKYDACVSQATNPQINIEYACTLFKGRGNDWDDWTTAKECGFVKN